MITRTASASTLIFSAERPWSSQLLRDQELLGDRQLLVERVARELMTSMRSLSGAGIEWVTFAVAMNITFERSYSTSR